MAQRPRSTCTTCTPPPVNSARPPPKLMGTEGSVSRLLPQLTQRFGRDPADGVIGVVLETTEILGRVPGPKLADRLNGPPADIGILVVEKLPESRHGLLVAQLAQCVSGNRADQGVRIPQERPDGRGLVARAGVADGADGIGSHDETLVLEEPDDVRDGGLELQPADGLADRDAVRLRPGAVDGRRRHEGQVFRAYARIAATLGRLAEV